MGGNMSGMLADYRDGVVSREQLLQWLNANQPTVLAQISRGALLKLQHGNDYVAMTTLAKILPACAICSGVCTEQTFTSWSDYQQCVTRVDAAEVAAKVVRIKPPAWTYNAGSEVGADAYYRCSTCGAIWGLVRPEKQENGSWRRLA